MDDGLTLFLSLPVDAQARLRARVDRSSPHNVRTLTRLVYAWVQTLAEAQCIADFLLAEPERAFSALMVERGKPPCADTQANSLGGSRMRSVPSVHA